MRIRVSLFAVVIAASILGTPWAAYAAPPSLPPGRYFTSVSLKETFDRIGMDPMTKSIPPGEWEVWLVEGNRYMIIRNGSMLFEEGRYPLTRQELALTPEATDFPCMLHLYGRSGPNPPTAGPWTAIVLTAVQEKCPGRLLVMTMHPLIRQV